MKQIKNYMKKPIGYILAIFFVSSQAFQCMHKEGFEDFNQSLLDCHQKTVWDSTSTAKALIGKWRWKQTVCPRTKNGASTDEASNIGLEFQVNSNGTLTELFNNVKVKEYTWSLSSTDGTFFSFTTLPYRDLLTGRLVICKDVEQLDIGNSYFDGCDFRYKKVE